MQKAAYKYFDVLMAFSVAVLLVSNIASSAKIVGFSVIGIPLAFDGGTLLFPLAYVLTDILTEVYGFRAARRVIWAGFVFLAFSALIFFVLRLLPGESSWEAQNGAATGSAAYLVVLRGMSSGGIVLASLAGYLVGEFSNSILLSKIKIMMKGRLFWFRAIVSSLAGEFLDSLIFVLIACLAGVFGWHLFLRLVLTNYVLKCLIEAIMLPLSYAAIRLLKKREGIDVYDEGKYRLVG
jgi:uncharacterized integral membrane protein (TIGR00697 family)